MFVKSLNKESLKLIEVNEIHMVIAACNRNVV
jgi:hypothetical protein